MGKKTFYESWGESRMSLSKNKRNPKARGKGKESSARGRETKNKKNPFHRKRES